MSAFDHFQTATCALSEGRRTDARRKLEAAIASIDRTGRDRNMRADLAALLASIQPELWRNDDGTWSHHRDAERRWSSKSTCQTDLRFHQEWRRNR